MFFASWCSEWEEVFFIIIKRYLPQGCSGPGPNEQTHHGPFITQRSRQAIARVRPCDDGPPLCRVPTQGGGQMWRSLAFVSCVMRLMRKLERATSKGGAAKGHSCAACRCSQSVLAYCSFSPNNGQYFVYWIFDGILYDIGWRGCSLWVSLKWVVEEFFY